ncbi:MAG: M23 family metallopeptidase [Microcoleus sp. SIO2G3]|nr:M23 family metallopeptidase [Microcoleus sp. SIO2G3]
MQQASKPRWNRKYKRLLLILLFLLGLTMSSLITLGDAKHEWVRASEAKSIQAANSNSWKGASFPVENFQGYTSGYGYRRSATGGSGREFHRGLDMAAPDGSYIRNWWTGQVVEVSDNTLCGTSIKIQSGEWTHIYCHMKGHVETGSSGRYLIDRTAGIQIWEGQQVPVGARIGRVGMTGRTTGPHLHWGLKYADQYVDPATVLRAMYTDQGSAGNVSSNLQQRD